jgi:hypothetical protein
VSTVEAVNIDVVAQGDEVVSEWSCIWTPRGTQTTFDDTRERMVRDARRQNL